jgi:hypothetical protein
MKPLPSTSSRRQFLQRSVLATGASVLGFPAIVSARSPNSKMNLALIATGGRGGAHVSEAKKMAELVDVVSMCDVNAKNLEYATGLFPQARTYRAPLPCCPRSGPKSTSTAKNRSLVMCMNAGW